MNVAVILASGVGKRMGAGKNKVLLRIGGRPVIYYALQAFQTHPLIDDVLIVAREEEKNFFKEITKKYRFSKVRTIITGGKERQDSAFNALRYLKEEKNLDKNSLIIFHNGANPFLSAREIDDSLREAEKHGACVVAHPTKDTIKEVTGNGLVEKTLERKKLWSMQTPQTIRFDLAFRAFSRAFREKFLGTDDVSLVERLGKKVKIIEGSLYNFKITTPMDLELAKIILKKYDF